MANTPSQKAAHEIVHDKIKRLVESARQDKSVKSIQINVNTKALQDGLPEGTKVGICSQMVTDD